MKKKRAFKKIQKINPLKKMSNQNFDKKLSLCMIVKNEESNLARCFESVKGVVDEIIVVDTGSTDKTIEIAKKYGAKVYEHEWNNSFSEARNKSIDYATGDWILVLDADEELSPHSRDKIRNFLISIEYDLSYDLTIRNLDSEGNVTTENCMTRLFQNKAAKRYHGDIHEFIPVNMGVHIRVSKDEVLILHYGYADKKLVEKKMKERNIPLLTKALEKNDLRARSGLLLYKGLSYLEMEDRDNAVISFKEGIAEFKNETLRADGFLNSYVFVILMLLYIAEDKMEDALALLESSTEYTDLLSVHCDYWYCKSRIETYKGELEEAIKSCKKAIEEYNSDKSVQTVTLKSYNNYGNALINLCFLYFVTKDYELAEEQVDISVKEVEKKSTLGMYVKIFADYYLELSKYNKAIELYEHALKTASSDYKKNIAMELSNLYLKLSQPAKAIRVQASVHDINNAKEVWYKIVEGFEDQKNFLVAEEIYTEIINVLPNEVRSYQGRFVARLCQNKPEEAFNDLSSIIKLSFSNEDIIKAALLCIQVNLFDQATSCFNKILKKEPNHYEANLNLANLEQNENKLHQSEERLERLIKVYPNKIDAYIQLGNMLINTKNFSKAIEVLNKAKDIEIDENNSYTNKAYIMYALAVASIENGDKELAKTYLESGLDLEPANQQLLKLEELILSYK